MRVLIACERSGRVRDAFRAMGHDAYSCDLEPAEDGRMDYHWQGDAIDVIHDEGPWGLLIAHPPCTYLAVSGLHWNGRVPGRAEKTTAALAFVQMLLDAPVARIAIENPVGAISTAIRKPDQIIQPYQFGDDASKKTCLWLKGLPPLVIPPMSQWVTPRFVRSPRGILLPRWSNQTDSGQNKLGPSDTRAQERSRTYPGIARAMAETWGR